MNDGTRAPRRRSATVLWILGIFLGVFGRAVVCSAQAEAPKAVVHGSWTQFLGTTSSGEGDDDVKLGGKLTGSLTIDGRGVRLWRGFTLNVGAEFVFGDSVNRSGAGAVLPLNTALMFPANGKEDFDLSLNVTQRFGASSLIVGKINMLDTVARTPLVGGGGLEGFQHVAFAATPSELTPPAIFGALWSRPSPRALVTLGGWDVTTALNRTGLSSPFSKGVAGMASVMLPRTLRRHRGFHTFTLLANTKRGVNLDDIGDLLLPPESGQVIGRKRGAWHLKYAVQQFLWSDSANPARGWGVFGHIGAWDANPTPMQWSMTAGVAGSPPFASRPLDRFGIGYFRSSFSSVLRDGLEPILALDDEHGVEAFYTFEVLRRVRVTGTAQWVDPSIRGIGSAVALGLRTRVAF